MATNPGNLKFDRVGEVSHTKCGTRATIIEYVNNKKVLVEFDDRFHFKYCTSYLNFKNGNLTNPYEKRGGCNSGYLGVGKYDSINHKLAYSKWAAMLKRCETANKPNNSDISISSYINCSVEDEWYNFQNFAEWFYHNIYECGEQLCVDKDILFHKNKIYSADRCLIVPKRINLLFIQEKGRRGNTLIGTYYQKEKGKYISMMSALNKTVYLGSFDNNIDAFEVYKNAKEKYIKEIADDYKNIIPMKLYEAMCNYEILITD